MLLYFKKL